MAKVVSLLVAATAAAAAAAAAASSSSSSSLGAAALSAGSDHQGLTPETFLQQSSEGISELLAAWGLDKVFAEEFAAVQVDGEALAHTPTADLEAAFASANIAKMHWNRLHRRLSPFLLDASEDEAASARKAGSVDLNFDSPDAPQRRLLESTVEPPGYSGIRMKQNRSLIAFGPDMAVLRTDNGLSAHTSTFTVHGDLNVTGRAFGEFPNSRVDLFGSALTTAAPSCRSILQRRSDASDGIYFITRLGSEPAYAAYCDMTRGGLELVFKVTHGIGGDAVDLWTSTVGLNEETRYMNILANDHYSSSRKASAWDHDQLLAVHTHLMQGNRVARYITFDPSDTTYTSWFSGDYAVDSDWTDLLTAEKNYFSMAGDATNGREFFVNGNYGGCTVDSGWMVLDNEAADPCTWETANNGDSGAIDILYSPLTTESPADAQWVQADTFAVLVDIDVVYDSCPDALEQLDYAAKNGHYWVDHKNQTSPQIVYCDMENGGYELVFKVVHGGGITDANSLWTGGTSGEAYSNSPLSGQSANPVDIDEHYVSPFRRSAFDSDLGLTVKEVDVRVVTEGVEKKYLHFVLDSDATYTSWFSIDYLQSSSWTDLPTATKNYFSIAGDTTNIRSFMVNANYGGCDVDAGWLVVAGKADGVCTWEDVEESYPDIRYSRLNTKDEANTYGVADLLAVFYLWQ